MILGMVNDLEIKDFVQNASKEQLTALMTMAQWMQEKSPEYCTCSVKCQENCQLVKEMGEAFAIAGQRLQSE
jgi:hypothetical protein